MHKCIYIYDNQSKLQITMDYIHNTHHAHRPNMCSVIYKIARTVLTPQTDTTHVYVERPCISCIYIHIYMLFIIMIIWGIRYLHVYGGH